MRLTVAICTRDRAPSIRQLMTSLVACAKPDDTSWEVLVVDNGSTDETASVLADFSGALPLRVVREATPGLSHARNAAVRAASGEYLLWTDDDCVVSREWLAAYAAALRRWPNAALFGGPVVPRFDGDAPTWLTRVAARVGAAYAARDLGDDPVELSLDGNLVPFGANYAVRASEQRDRPYDARLGRGAHFPMAVGEESEVLEGLLREGAGGRWVPEAIVIHRIPPERQRLSYLREYYAAYGAYEEWRRHEGTGGLSSSDDLSTLQLLRLALRSELRYQVLRRVGRPEAWIDDLIAASVARGRMRAKRALAATR